MALKTFLEGVMKTIFQSSLTALLALVFAGLPSGVWAAFNSSKDWPCIQREVPQISAGMVWTAEPVDADDKTWSRKPGVGAAVQAVTSRRKTVEEALKAVDEYAAGLKDDRKDRLTALFVGALQRLNAERRQIMAGIKRYARRQAALADLIKKKSLEEAELLQLASPTDAQKQRLAQLREEIAWDTRIYDEREQSLTYVCETPVLMERRLYQIGRHISAMVKE